jgi:EF-hand domain pair
MDERSQLSGELAQRVAQRFGAGGWHSAFATMDRDRDGLISALELASILEASDVGTLAAREEWAQQTIALVDRDGDGRISFLELQRAVAPSALAGLEPGARSPAPVPVPAPAPAKSKNSHDVLFGLGLAFVGYRVFVRRR